MKDYKLSEIKAICKKYAGDKKCHKECPLYRGDNVGIRCQANMLYNEPCFWQIDEEEQDDE